MLSRAFKLPPWVTPACAINNTTSLPLLLLQSLESIGSLNPIISKGETTSAAIERAQSYFLVCAVISKTTGYIIGPRLLREQNGDDDNSGQDAEHGQRGQVSEEHEQ